MKNLILSTALALSSVIAPVVSHAATPSEFLRREHDERAAVVQPVQVQPVYAQPVYAGSAYIQPTVVAPAYVQPAYVQPVSAQPRVIAHRDERRVERDGRDRGREMRRDEGRRFDGGHGRDEGRWQERGDWRR